MSDISTNQKFKNALCYIPWVAIVLLFAEDGKTKEFMKHIKYWIALLWLFVLIRFVLVTVLHLYSGWTMLAFFYILLSAYLWYKAYVGQDINLESIDKMEDKIKDNFDVNFPEKIQKKVTKKIIKKKK